MIRRLKRALRALGREAAQPLCGRYVRDRFRALRLQHDYASARYRAYEGRIICDHCGTSVPMLAEPIDWDEDDVYYGPTTGDCACGRVYVVQVDGSLEVLGPSAPEPKSRQ